MTQKQKGQTKVLLFVDWFVPGYKAGGPIQTILGMVRALSQDVEFLIVTRDRDREDRHPYPSVTVGRWNAFESGRVFYVSPGLVGFCALLGCLRTAEYEVLYLNSVMSRPFTIFPLLARRLGIFAKVPVIIAPRGEFAPAALGLKAAKKGVYMAVAKYFGLYDDVTWHASTDLERADILRQFDAPDTSVVVASNFPTCAVPVPERLRQKSAGTVRLVALSRVSQMKNLAFTLEILAQVKGTVVFDIYGPCEDIPYWNSCQQLIGRLPGNISASYKGAVAHEDVASVLSSYDFLILPTLGENFGHVILESFAAGLPVIISDRTPWRDLSTHGIGWDIALEDRQRFVAAIETAVAMGADEHRLTCRQALAYAARIRNSTETLLANRRLFGVQVE